MTSKAGYTVTMTTHPGYKYERTKPWTHDVIAPAAVVNAAGAASWATESRTIPGYDEWVSEDPEGVITIQKEDGKKVYTFGVLIASGPYAVGPYPGTPEWDEFYVCEGEAYSFDAADACARAALAIVERDERLQAEAEDAYAREMEAEAREDFGYFGDPNLVGE